ncbi:hypothetical protein [Gelatiniphilus marinus]|uniref:LVIVD repeat-containing protein n=1 Tax=Gelatiniphilus marinus TaxID=1759464 RepID=A0ABW5JVC0_9FLAO
MKLKFLFLSLVFFSLISCEKDDVEYQFVKVATPELMSKTAFRNLVKVEPPTNIKEAGKIYAYKDYIFVSDAKAGVHIIDNSNPESPKAIKFINIPANEDISVKDDFLYADSATDLVVFDISDINTISIVERLEDVFDFYHEIPNIPEGTQLMDYAKYDANTHIIVGWTQSLERRKKEDFVWGTGDIFFSDGNGLTNVSESVIGTGGSLARFQIVKNYLYTVGTRKMNIFNIQNLKSPILENTQQAGWNIETMFQADNHLYLGSTRGMYIYSLANPAAPEYVSEFVHWESCDPVVVDGDYAYVTLRGGNLCGQQESVLEIIDISDKTKPTLAVRYGLENPYGLGIKGNMLFVCDGTAGLKLFDKTDPLNISMTKNLKNIQATDVIPLENTLIMIGGNTLYQYQYGINDVKLISTFSLN